MGTVIAGCVVLLYLAEVIGMLMGMSGTCALILLGVIAFLSCVLAAIGSCEGFNSGPPEPAENWMA